jgi:hypothetical protein
MLLNLAIGSNVQNIQAYRCRWQKMVGIVLVVCTPEALTSRTQRQDIFDTRPFLGNKHTEDYS